MKKVVDFFKETDKQLHILACFALGVIVALVMRKHGCEKIDAALYGWMVAFAVAFLKELYDEMKRKGSDVRDWIADVIGYTSAALFTLCTMM